MNAPSSRRRLGLRGAAISAIAAAALGLVLAGPAAAQSKPLKPVTLVVEWIGYQPQHFGFWLARDLGYYADEGLDVTIKGSRGSGQVLQIMAGGGAEFSNVAASTFTQAQGKAPLPMKMVALWGQKDILSVAYFQSTGIKSVKDFEGRTIGMVPGSMVHLIWPAFVKAAGIDPAKVKVQNWDFRSYYGIWAAKKVDISGNMASGTSIPYMFKKRYGETVEQVVISDYLPILGPGVMVRDETIEKDPEMVRAFVKATQRAWDYLRDKPAEATLEAGKIVSKHYEKIDPPDELAKGALQVIPSHMSIPETKGKPLGWMSPETWTKMVDLLAEFDKNMTRKPAVSELMTNRFVE